MEKVAHMRDRQYTPSADFVEQMHRHANDPVVDCPFVPCDIERPDYNCLSEEQIRYYVRWRDALRKGEMLEFEPGYMYIRVCELINIPEDLDSSLKQIGIMLYQGRCYWMEDLYFDYCVVNGIVPHIPRGRDMISGEIIRGYTLDYPVSNVYAVEWLCRYPFGNNYYEADDDRFCELFNLSLQEIERYLMETQGGGIAEIYGEGTVSTQFSVYKGLFYEGDREYTVRYPHISPNSDANTLLTGVAKMCLNLVCKEAGNKGPAVPKSLPKDIKDLITAASLSGKSYEERLPMKELDRSLSSAESGIMLVPESFRYMSAPRVNVLQDLKNSHAASSSGPAPYVPSSDQFPLFKSMTDGQKAFYLHWRSEVRQGRYPLTDVGYVRLYLAEVINLEDTERAEQILSGMTKAYEEGKISEDTGWSFYDWGHFIGRTYLDFTIAEGLPLPSNSMYPCTLTGNDTIYRMLNGQDYSASNLLSKWMSDATKSMAKDIDSDVSEIFFRMLIEIDRRTPNGIASRCRIRSKKEKIDCFDNLPYYNFPGNRRKYLEITAVDYLSSSTFTSECREVIKAATAAVRAHRSGKWPAKNEVYAFGVLLENVREIADSYFSSKAMRQRRRDVSLDPEMVDAATKALDETTKMMATESDEPMAQANMPAKEPVATGWDGFVSSLTPAERKLIVGLLSGDGPAPAPRMEDSINGKALDSVGDILIEDGGIVEDYYTDIKVALRTSSGSEE